MASTIERRIEVEKQILEFANQMVVDGTEALEGCLRSIKADGTCTTFSTSLAVAGMAMDTTAVGDTAQVRWGAYYWFDKSDASASDVGKAAYAADNTTVTLTPNTAKMGMIADWRTGGVLVKLDRIISA